MILTVSAEISYVSATLAQTPAMRLFFDSVPFIL
ncbi:Hypothetical protein DIP0046 [Corynebacterium diphtheriae]|uniref:Uncharacterized protein n=1 Tax=Corynebacterium diphtheriae (strain ATCC 700971 / NCTC 13129 / Biotype gravis) TaxID=257309 RepID=Q6NKH8_CORDI|nr:Hypothetical protein DIP0046 [Corynebacterium diphtheriae]